MFILFLSVVSLLAVVVLVSLAHLTVDATMPNRGFRRH